MSLNEKLAEVCGYKRTNYKYTDVTGCRCSGVGFEKDSNLIHYADWNPTSDLNQLRECYLAAEKTWSQHAPYSFEYLFYEELTILLDAYPFVDKALAMAWINHPELVAQAILKAKGVS